jgi:hypothetical protein
MSTRRHELLRARLRTRKLSRALKHIGPENPNYDLAWERAIAASNKLKALEAIQLKESLRSQQAQARYRMTHHSRSR